MSRRTAPPDLPYRQGVGVMLFNKDGRVLVALRVDTPDAWQMPQGGMDRGESVRQAALRELREEIGTDKAEILAEMTEPHRYDFPSYLRGKAYSGRYRGQEQIWVAARFTGEDSDIDLNAHHEPEFSAWRWVDIDELLQLIVPFKRPIYEAVVREFRRFATPG